MNKLVVLARKFYKIPYLQLFWDSREYAAMRECFLSNSVVDGNAPEKLSKSLARRFGFRSVLPANYGRSAIQLALERLDRDGRDEVVVPSFGCTGTIQPILQAGFKPVFCDMGPDFRVRAQDVEAALSKKTRAVIVPGLYGLPADWRGIKPLCQERGLSVIDDAAQTLGCPNAGANGDAGVFSLSLGKMLSSTGGGVLCSNRPSPFERLPREKYPKVASRAAGVVLRAGCRRFTLPFFSVKDELRRRLKPAGFAFDERGMANLDAAVALRQLDKLSAAVRLRERNARILLDELGSCGGVSLPEAGRGRVFTKFVVSLDEGRAGRGRLERGRNTTDFVRFMARKGVECEWVYLPLHYRAPFDAFAGRRLPETEGFWFRSVALPVAPSIGEEGMKFVAGAAKKFFA